jgi:hypothetical protein
MPQQDFYGEASHGLPVGLMTGESGYAFATATDDAETFGNAILTCLQFFADISGQGVIETVECGGPRIVKPGVVQQPGGHRNG